MTEIIWEGKYKDGKKVAPVNIALPFQTVESVNESTQQRQTMLDLFSAGKDAEWRNRLIWGDKKYVLPSLLPEFAGKVNLIYIDPPFDTGANFSFTATIPDNPETADDEEIQFIKEPNIIEQKAYRDTWGKGLDSYLQWFYEAALMLRELLADNGSLYVHLDWHVDHYVKCVLDEVFSYDCFKSDIKWKRVVSTGSSKSISKKYPVVDDSIFFYTKSFKEYTWNTQYNEYSEEYRKRFTQRDKRGYFYWDNLKSYSQATLKRLIADDRIKLPLVEGRNPRVKNYLHEGKGVVLDNIWSDIIPVNSQAIEDTSYSTQKPEALLERIIKASSNENDLVLDCFCGSGTTAATAEKLNRRWITCDLGRFAIHTTRKRLLQIPNVKPFIVQNLGKYERQQWVSAEFTNIEDRLAQEKAYRNFIIELYHAQPIQGYVYLHGSKSGRMVHVGAVDAPVSMGDIKSIIQEFWKTVGKNKEITRNGIDVLGWDFAFELNETALQFAASNKIDLKFKKIPREVLEKKAVEQGDIKFFEMASLGVKVKKAKSGVTISLDNFIVPPDDVPQEVQSNITHWSQWIDYWAIDWDYKNDTFHNQYQSYRSRQNSTIELFTSHTYEKSGKYSVLVKVIDILGNDTTKLLSVEI